MITIVEIITLVIFIVVVSAEKQPNIIFILADDLGNAGVGFTGVSAVKTPNLDKLASEGVRLTQHYSQPVCTPTRASIMTGRHPIHTGLQHYVIRPGQPFGLPLDEVILPQIMKEYNYSTHMVGKWHLGFHKWAYTPVYRGFDDFLGMYVGAEDYWTHFRDGGLDLRSDRFNEAGEFEQELRRDLDGEYSPEYYSRHTIDLIHKHKSEDNPFFIYLPYQSTHLPFQVPQHYIDKYSSHFRYRAEQVFAGMVSAMDEGIGNITSAVIDSGIADNTIIIFTTDNGGYVHDVDDPKQSGSCNYPFRGGKKSVYEGGIRTPTLVWAPGKVAPRGEVSAMFHVTDWFPTIWSLASLGGKLEPNRPISTKPLDGVDQWDVITGQQPPKREEFLINIDPLLKVNPNPIGELPSRINPKAALRWKNWKLIIGGGGPPFFWSPLPRPVSLENLDAGNTNFTQEITCIYCKDYTNYIELFDIEKDPSEVWNVYQQYPEVVELMRIKLDGYNLTAVTPLNKPYDPASNPKYFNNTWMPWMEEKLDQQNSVENEITDIEDNFKYFEF